MKHLGTFLLLILMALGVQAKEYTGKSQKPKNPSASSLSKMVDCNPPIAYTEFALNNVRFGLEAGGQIWEDNGDASYEIPKVDPESGEISIHSLYAGALWIGGYSPDGQLKLAAVTYRTGGGTDFFNGPLSNNGFATADFCNTTGYSEFDTHFPTGNTAPDFTGNRRAGVTRTDVQIHRSYFQCQDDPDCNLAELFPDGYTMPSYFDNWPGYNSDPNYSAFLAPYFDYNGNSLYDPENGDYPWFDLDNAIDCRTRKVTDPIPLFGDEAIWWVFNDNGGIHTETGGQQIGMEIQAQAFAYTTTDEINNMTFYNYVLINRGNQTLRDCYFGQWVDPDLGCPTDDYVGCDVERGLGYAYNGDENDAACDGVPGYDNLPPAVGIDFFEGPFQDPDYLGPNNTLIFGDTIGAILDDNGNAIGFDNPLTTNVAIANDLRGIPYPGIGIGYGDGVPNNERFGMRKFVYYNRDDQTPTPNINGEPDIAIDFYNYLDGVWLNNEPMSYGGNGVGGSIEADFMFPALTDSVGFGTAGQVTNTDWTEATEGNQAGDRRFIQSAGTFRLDPGEFNNITVGVVWVRPFGNTEVTLNALKIADDKAQALFDNCFRILSGPDAPDLSAQEMDQEILLYITNENPTSNNYRESYGFPSDFAFDPLIPDITSDGTSIPDVDKYYEFQGYKIFQLKDASVSSADLGDIDRARLIFQTDKQDGISQIINFEDDPQLQMKVPVEAVNGNNEGIRHSFRVTTDAFATESPNLVNFKRYYFMAVAYAYNNYEDYNTETLAGQSLPYLESRKTASGGIPVITAIPHNPKLEEGGTIVNSGFEDVIPVTRLEGEGNGGNYAEITQETRVRIVESPYGVVNELDYVRNASPVNIRVVDPMKVEKGSFTFGLIPQDDANVQSVSSEWDLTDNSNIDWFLLNDAGGDTIFSYNSIGVGGEQLLLDYGISIEVEQYEYETIEGSSNVYPLFAGASLTFEDESNPWLTGVPDRDGATEQNWIRSGENTDGDDGPDDDPSTELYYVDFLNIDPQEEFENILGGIISPWHVAAASWTGPAYSDDSFQSSSSTRMSDLNSVDIVFTSNKDHWTRVPVLENQQFTGASAGAQEKNRSRIALSVDKNGRNQLNGGNYDECTMNGTQTMTEDFLDDLSNGEKDRYKAAAWPNEDPDNHSDDELLSLSFGMGWFPGYAVDIETGERLNMAFSENSALALENGRDMIWNPTSTIWNEGAGGENSPSNARFGGLHYIYVFRNFNRQSLDFRRIQHYDNGAFMFHNINGGTTERRRIFRSCTWVMLPLLAEGSELLPIEDGLIPNDAVVSVRPAKPYARYATIADVYDRYVIEDSEFPWTQDYPYFYWDDESGVLFPELYDAGFFPEPSDGETFPAYDVSRNGWLPYYSFSTDAAAPSTAVNQVLVNSLEMNDVNVVPNPYYGTSDYELTRLDNRVKIINLPADKTVRVRIYDAGGVLVRTIEKDSPDTFVDWDLKNERNVPIAGGVHIFHIEIPGVGEKVVKWFGVMRPIDLDNF